MCLKVSVEEWLAAIVGFHNLQKAIQDNLKLHVVFYNIDNNG